MRTAALALALVSLAGCDLVAPAATYESPHHIVIGLDLSKSNPLVINQIYASKVAKRVGSMIENLPMRSKVTVRTFGVYNAAANNLRINRVISRRHPAKQVSSVVEGVIAGVPKLISRGTLRAQMKTNILSFLDNMAQVLDCSEMPTIVVLASDGIEDSELARQTRSTDTLPPPIGQPFAGCERLEILGIGQGVNLPSVTARLRQQWGDWANQAGFKEFRGLNDW